MIKSTEYVLDVTQIKPKLSGVIGLKDAKNVRAVKIHSMDLKDMEIDFIGFDFSLVNAYRRIVLAEVATMAIEKIHMYKNTSVVQDEVLAHRIGLVPLNIPPHFFNFRTSDEETLNEDTCVKYRMRVKCRGKKDSRESKSQLARQEDEIDDVDSVLVDKLVTSEDLTWVPIGSQSAMFVDNPLTPLREQLNLPDKVQAVNTDLVLAKLNPGQRILLEAYAFKGIGSDHAKFQPGLCWYRMLPVVTLQRKVLGDDARLLQQCFSPGVIDVVTNEQGEDEAVVRDARYDSCSRNVYNYDQLKGAVEMTRRADHIIFHIESQSALRSSDILLAAVDVMTRKCDNLLEELTSLQEM